MALKHDYKRYLEHFFLQSCAKTYTAMAENLSRKPSPSSGLSRQKKATLSMKPVTLTTKILHVVHSTETEITRDGARFALSSAEKQRLKLLANGSRNQDYSDDSGRR